MNRLLRGFTLIEIIIVILIMSIIATIAMMTISRNEKKDIETLAKEIKNLLTLASEEAMLRPATLGLAFTPTTFQFYVYQENKTHTFTWVPITKPPLNSHSFANNIKMTIKIQGKEIPLNGQPQITISESGDITPFTLLLGTKKGGYFYRVTESGNGHLNNEPAHEE